MRKPEQAPEPSIEEILASIRRIIADDTPAAAPAQAVSESDMSQQAYGGDRRLRAVEGGQRPAEARSEDEVLELTEDFMLAEEAASVQLQEPDEPAGVYESEAGYESDAGYESEVEVGTYERRSYHDPYAVTDARQQEDEEPVAATLASNDAAEQTTQADEAIEEQAGGSSGEGIASVMAEVERFVGFSHRPEHELESDRHAGAQPESDAELEYGQRQSEAAEPLAETAPAAEALSSTPIMETGAAENWGQPDLGALTPDSNPRPAPRWSARGMPADSGKPAEAAPARGNWGEPASQAPGLGAGRDNWSQGVQMPVPEDGPAIPFAPQDMAAQAETEKETSLSAGPVAEDDAVLPAHDTPQAALPAEFPSTITDDLQMRAEQLAEKAVADFATDKLSVPPVAAILKADKPLMNEITNTLAGALNKGADESEEFEDAVPPLEDYAEEGFAPASPAPQPGGAAASPAATSSPAAPKLGHLDGGFVAARPAAPPQAAAPAPVFSDTDPPELDDLPHADLADAPSYRPGGLMEAPVMSHTPSAPARMTSLQAPGLGSGREMSVLQPSASGQKSLEETIREMLKPLLVQWLNENMPRIIDEAIREEMAAAGLLARKDPER